MLVSPQVTSIFLSLDVNLHTILDPFASDEASLPSSAASPAASVQSRSTAKSSILNLLSPVAEPPVEVIVTSKSSVICWDAIEFLNAEYTVSIVCWSLPTLRNQE